MRNLVLIVILFLLISFQKSEIEIIDKFINYDEERIQLSIDYLKTRHGISQKNQIITPKIIVVHYTAGGTVATNFAYFNKNKLEDKRAYLQNNSILNVSSQFIIDRDGKIYRLMPENWFARHTIGLNYCAIGIENIGSKTQPLTEAQVKANAELVKYLCKKYKIEYLIGHHEYGNFRNSELWKETDSKYFTGKEDPGAAFMTKVRNLVKDLNLKNKPE